MHPRMHYERVAVIYSLSRNECSKILPYCKSKSGKFCVCQAVANEPPFKEWYPSNPPASQVSRCSPKECLWVCPKGHLPYKASCISGCSHNSGCLVCGVKKSRTACHPVVSFGRPDLAQEWAVLYFQDQVIKAGRSGALSLKSVMAYIPRT